MKKFIYIGMGLIIVLFIGLLFAGNYFYSESVKRGVEVELHREPEAVTAFADQENYIIEEAKRWYAEQTFETIELTSNDGLLLKAKYLENDQSTNKAIILAHGYRNESDDMRDYVQFYYQQGFDIVIPDARGHGESQGDYIGYGWHDRKDYQQWIELLIDQKNMENIYLHGVSMGASLVLMTSGEELPSEVKGIIADSGYSSVKDVLTHQLKHLYNLPSFPVLPVTSVITNIRVGYTFNEASALEQVKKNSRPLLIIHGEADELVPTNMAYNIYDSAAGEKELWIVPLAGHVKSYSVATEEFQERILSFIGKSIE